MTLAGMLFLTTGMTLVPAHAADTPDWLRWLDREGVRRIELTGYRRLGYHLRDVSGDRESYDVTNYFGLGGKRFTDIGQIDFVGRRVFGLFNFRGTILDSRFTDPQGQRFSLDFNRGGVQFSAGDIQGTLLNTNPLARMSKSLRGVSVAYRRGNFEGKALYSEARGSARTITIPGNNSAGPFYLQVNQLVQGSEQVRLDDQPLQAGRDYVISYEAGFITLVGRVLAPTSVLVVSFEVLGFNDRRGQVQGAGLSYDFGRAGRLGLTAARQIARTGGAASTRLERFQGFGPPSTPYVLLFEPLAGTPITVQVDGIVQRPGLDYRFDAINTAIFYLNRFVPSTSTVTVIYTPRPTSTANGDREVLGIDYRIPLGKAGQSGTVTLAQATGRLFNSSTPSSGVARSASLDYRQSAWDVQAQVRAVPEGFVSVETRGFNRNETGHEVTLGYRSDPRTRWTLGTGNRSIQTSSSASPTPSSARFANTRLAVSTSTRKGTPYTFEVRQQHSRTLAGPTQLTIAEASTAQNLGRVELRLAASRQSGRTPLAGTSGSRRVGVGLTTASVEAALPVTDSLRLQGNYALSDITVDGDRGAGRDAGLSLDYRPSDLWRATVNYTDSDSGQLATLGGFTNGWGLGYDGNGFSGGVNGSLNTGSSRVKLVSANVAYTAGNLTLQANASQSDQSGSVTTNAKSTSYGVGGSYELRSNVRLLARVDRTNSRFVGSASRSDSTTYSILVDASPPGRWSGQLGYSGLVNGSRTAFAQDSASIELNSRYDLGKRQALVLDATLGTASGYLAQDDSDVGITYQYRLWSALALNVSYRFRRVTNQSPGVTSGAYRSQSLDFILDFNFAGR